jgi:rhodanese-related sulfurtransferase
MTMKQRIFQAILVAVVAIVMALISNSFSGSRIPVIGHWPSISGSDSVIVPPSAEKGDPPFISLDEAAAKFQSRNVIFVDARDPADYEYGRIAGSINLPFEMLDEYWPKVAPNIPATREIVVYCSGGECESSLFLGRYMKSNGYDNIFVFYGGWSEWEKAKLPIATGGIDDSR